MSSHSLSRREFLTLPLALALARLMRAEAAVISHGATYGVDVGILYKALKFRLDGTIDEAVDRAGGSYAMKIVGRGSGIANRVESSGILRQGRWAPLRTTAWFDVAGRESRSEVTYDYERRTAEYHYHGETFFLRRSRVADDVLTIPDATHVDDVISAILNHADGRWPARADGAFETHIVRRQRRETEGPDDADASYRAELVPFVLKVTSDPESGKATAVFDLTRFSSWAREDRPARIVFGPDRRPELITSSLILGTSVTIRIQ